jgi:hypothetical protein
MPAANSIDASGSPESRAQKRLRKLWQLGDLFHATNRYPRRREHPRIDRLAGILRSGLVAPSACQDGTVCCDLSIVYHDAPVPYDSLVFLHRFGEQSWLYTICEPGRFFVFVDPALPVMTQEAMGENWVILCQDEVYVRERVPLESLIGIVVHPDDAEAIKSEFLDDFRRLALPLYDYKGEVVWPPA